MNNKEIKILFTAIIMLAFGSTAFARQAEEGYVLIVQQSPADAGLVTPSVGIHRPQLNETVSIQAIPKLGYSFVYWMGDVQNPTANRTTVSLDSPKLIIAVFEREDFELLTPSDSSTKKSGGGAINNSGIPGQGSGGDVPYEWPQRPPFERPERPDSPYVPVPGGGEPTDTEIPVPGEDYEIPVPGGDYDIPVPGGDTEIPVPGDDNEIPVPGQEDPIPEPATMAILAAGAIFLRKRRPAQK